MVPFSEAVSRSFSTALAFRSSSLIRKRRRTLVSTNALFIGADSADHRLLPDLVDAHAEIRHRPPEVEDRLSLPDRGQGAVRIQQQRIPFAPLPTGGQSLGPG